MDKQTFSPGIVLEPHFTRRYRHVRYKTWVDCIFFAAFFIFMAANSVLAAGHDRRRTVRTARLQEFENCQDRPLRPYRLTEKEIFVQAKSVYSMNAEGVSTRATTSLEKTVVNITKCTDRSKSRCEHLRRLEWNGGIVMCPFMTGNDLPWSSIMAAFIPRIGCRNEKGSFKVRNMTADYRALSKGMQFGGEDYWIINWEFFDQNLSPFLCFHIEADFPSVRV